MGITVDWVEIKFGLMMTTKAKEKENKLFASWHFSRIPISRSGEERKRENG